MNGRTTGFLLAAVLAVVACADAPQPRSGEPSSPVSEPPAFDGELRCPAGEEHGAAGWDYGANPKGTIEDPVGWFRNNAVGLDTGLKLSFVEEVRGRSDTLHNVVLAENEDGLVVAFIEFGRDDEGRYLPNYAEACASAGIQDFT